MVAVDAFVGFFCFCDFEEFDVLLREVKGFKLFKVFRLGVKLEAEPNIFFDKEVVPELEALGWFVLWEVFLALFET